jgi:hypothetical protein
MTRKSHNLASLLVFASIVVALSACGYAGTPPMTKPGSIVVTASPTAFTTSASASQQFQAVVSGTTNAPTVWDVNGIVRGNSSLGTIITSSANTATYAPPVSLRTTIPVTIHATSGAVTAAATVSIVSDVTVSVVPASATMARSESLTLTLTVSGPPDANVSSTVSGVARGNVTVGQICVLAICAPARLPRRSRRREYKLQRATASCFAVNSVGSPQKKRLPGKSEAVLLLCVLLKRGGLFYCDGKSCCEKPVVFTERSVGV